MFLLTPFSALLFNFLTYVKVLILKGNNQKHPKEIDNDYDHPAYAQVVKEMKHKLGAVRKKYKGSDELCNGYLELYKEKGWINELIGVKRQL